MEQYRGGREDTYSFDGQRHKQSKLSPRRGLTAYEWRDKMDNIRSEVAMIEKQSTKRVLHSAGKLDTVLQESFRKIKEPSEIDIRLAVNTHQHDMEELQNRQEQMNSEIDSFKVKHGIYSKGTYLGEKDKLKADKAANTVVKLVRAKYAAKLIDKKRKEWLVSLGVQRTGKNQNCESETTHKGAVEEDAVEKLATMPHIANLLYQLVEPPEPLLGWLWMSEIDEDQVSLIWTRYWARVADKDPREQEEINGQATAARGDEGGRPSAPRAADAGPWLSLSCDVLGPAAKVLCLKGARAQPLAPGAEGSPGGSPLPAAAAGAAAEASPSPSPRAAGGGGGGGRAAAGAGSADRAHQLLVTQASGRQHWFAARDAETQEAWVSRLQELIKPPPMISKYNGRTVETMLRQFVENKECKQ